MAVKVFVNGQVVDEADAMVSVFDRGFLYGDSVYEVMRTSGGIAVDYERHLVRLAGSAKSIWLPMPTVEEIRSAVSATLEAADNAESYIRIILTRGSGAIGLDPSLAQDARLFVIVRPLSLQPPALYETGASVRIVGVRRTSREAVDPSVKSGNYLNNILALTEARRFGAHEAVMLSPDGLVAEGSTSNIFAVAGGVILTPSIAVGLLVGITRRRVIDLARSADFEVREGSMTADALREADEVFITSSVRGIMPIRKVDDCDKTAPGPVTAQLMAAYASFLADVAAKTPLV